jgi:hypothetical protein
MAKKIYDVVPPKTAKKIEKDIKEFFSEDKKKTKRRSKPKREGRSIWFPVSIAGGVLILIVGVYLFFKLPRVEVQIWPKVDVLSFQQTIEANKSADLTDIEEALVPAKFFETSKTLSEEFQATGNATNEGKASGTIAVYNKSDPPTPITFKAGTHFMSDSGMLFKASERIVIPAAKKSGSKITPGSVKVKVEAVEGGDNYNISSSDFSVPGLKGTAYYYNIYASSDEPMTGGYTGKIKKVTDIDIQEAEDALTKKLTSEAVAELENQISSDYILLENAISSEITNSGTQTKSGTVTDNFVYEATIKVSALAFKKSDIDEFAKKYIISQMLEGKTFLDSSLKVNYSATAVDISDGKATLDLDFSSGVYQNIDKNSLALSLTGKNLSQIKDTVSSRFGDQLSKVEVKLWPFWVTKSPKSQKAVNVILKFE